MYIISLISSLGDTKSPQEGEDEDAFNDAVGAINVGSVDRKMSLLLPMNRRMSELSTSSIVEDEGT